ncbi:ParB/RepB/Spo0J family partition protein [Sphingomonas carotinifaciens]|uniref:ParB/RepB/Spo0J family partition protein n=1 Tax=Sphingomonas carotinifaciens TaxID=1166323 RepID=UPI000DD8425E|nr:ParB/RepB/Spo0J family partition protein [Sphingomonas carotinifaciens]
MSVTTKSPKAIAPEARIARVPTNSLRANPHNPRMLFDREPLKALEESIRNNNILVPLTVFMASGSDKYTILDGQRRWICAQNIKMPTVPINVVAEPTTAQNIVTMFQIHKLRKDWELMPTALKIEVLIGEIGKQSDSQLSVITGLDVSVVTRCKKLLSYSNKYRNMMLMADPKDRIKADFFIELYPVLTDRVLERAKLHREHVIDRMLFKYDRRKSGLRSITDFRKIKAYVAIAKAAGQEDVIVKRYRDFIDDDTYDLTALEIDTARVHKHATTITKDALKLRQSLEELLIGEYLGEDNFWVELEKLAATIYAKVKHADRRRAT